MIERQSYDKLNNGELMSRDTLFNHFVKLAESCSSYHDGCDGCPKCYRDDCESLFNILSGKIHHKRMSFAQLVCYSSRLLKILQRRLEGCADYDEIMLSGAKHEVQVLLGRRGGISRAKRLTPEARRDIAQAAARIRWNKEEAACSEKGA